MTLSTRKDESYNKHFTMTPELFPHRASEDVCRGTRNPDPAVPIAITTCIERSGAAVRSGIRPLFFCRLHRCDLLLQARRQDACQAATLHAVMIVPKVSDSLLAPGLDLA